MSSLPLRAALLCLASSPAFACDPVTGEREQRVFLEWNGARVDDWTVADAGPRRVELPNGFVLGVAIEPADEAKYVRLAEQQRRVPELVKITLSDLGTTPARELTHTWGGANSIQGYGALGGADRVVELGDPGIRLVLLNPVCATFSPGGAVATHEAPVASRNAPVATPAPPASAEARFGLPVDRGGDTDEIVSQVGAEFRGWGPGSRIRLANGQEWQIVDGSSAMVGRGVGPGVRVVRAALGSYKMKFDGLSKAPRVRRVK